MLDSFKGYLKLRQPLIITETYVTEIRQISVIYSESHNNASVKSRGTEKNSVKVGLCSPAAVAPSCSQLS